MKQQQLGKKQNWFLRTARRIAAPLLVAGIMALGSKADAIQTRPTNYAGGNQSATIATTKSDNKIIVSLIVINPPQTPKGLMNRIINKCKYRQAHQAWAVQACILNESKKLSQRIVHPTNLYSKKGARFTFSYWNPFRVGGPGWVAVPGCKNVVANKETKVKNIPYFIGTCKVKKKLYKGRRLSIKVTYLPSPFENLNVAEARMVLNKSGR